MMTNVHFSKHTIITFSDFLHEVDVIWTSNATCQTIIRKNKLAFLRVRLVGEMEEQEYRKLWEDRKVGRQKIFSFLSFLFGWRGRKVERWKFFSFVEMKNERMENEVSINLPLCPYQIYKQKVTHFLIKKNFVWRLQIFIFKFIKYANVKRIEKKKKTKKKTQIRTNIMCVINGTPLSKKRGGGGGSKKNKRTKIWLVAILSFINNRQSHACFLSILERQCFLWAMPGPIQKFLSPSLLTKQDLLPFSLIYFPPTLFHLQPNTP